MTILSTIQQVAPKIGIDVPTAVFGETARELVELQSFAKESAQRIYKAYDWELLKTLQTDAGDGSTTAFALPSDYGRMLAQGNVWNTTLQTPFIPITSADRWLELDIRSYSFVTGVWIKIGGQINIKPAMATGTSAKYYYISNLIVAPSAGSNKVAFTADDDSFRLNEELLKLHLIYTWKEEKGMAYAEDMARYEELLAQLINEDKGARVLRSGRPSAYSGVRIAYPQQITA